MATSFDFGALDLGAKAETPFEFEIHHPETKEGLGVFVSVIGQESETFLRYVRDEGNAARRRAFEAQRRGKVDEPQTIEQEEESLLKALAVCVVAWRTGSKPVIVDGGEELECSRVNVVRWLSKYRWVRAQVQAASGDIGNFTKG